MTGESQGIKDTSQQFLNILYFEGNSVELTELKALQLGFVKVQVSSSKQGWDKLK